MDISVLYSSAVDLTALLLGVMGMLIPLIVRDTDKWWRNYCVFFFIVMTLKSASSLISLISVIYWNNVPLQTSLDFICTLCSSAIIPMLTMYILHCCSEALRSSRLLRAILVLWGVGIAAMTADLLTNMFFYIPSSDGTVKPRYFVLVYLSVTVTGLIINVIALIRRRKKLSRMQIIVILCYLLAPVSLMILAVELMLFADQGKRYLDQKAELAKQKASNAVLQMRPHFIYNTMTSIYYLIEQDADKAQQVTLNFTDYLRKNFTAIAKKGTVPFSTELEHTKAYLSVEQMRFEDKLLIELDTPYTDFRLPPLTLQPIVENAVKHGIDPDLDPLHIAVHTKKLKNGTEIIVEDTGPGFGVTDSGHPHIALSNIQERLEMMCRGTLTFSDRNGGGTVVRLYIPDKNNESGNGKDFPQ